MLLFLPYQQDQTNQANQPNIHVYPDWAAMQVTNLLPSFSLYLDDWSFHCSCIFSVM